jgi:predicted ATP-dependent endonuclease of OLD family
MSATILLVEGDSEYESFPIYSYHCGKIFSVHDIEIVRVGGKGKFEKYINIFKKFGKTVYVLIDNDPDSTRKIKDISKIADVIFVSQNSYEDLIFPYITIIADKLVDWLH